MKIDDLLEKKEASQVAIFRQLILSGGKVSQGNLLRKSGISKLSLETYLEEITDRLLTYNGAVQMLYDNREISLVMTDTFSMTKVYQDYVEESLKFQILDYAFQHREFTIVKLASALSLSESSLFRKIKEINVLLKEFQIQIKNGSLVGEELQIRYFYFNLNWFLKSSEEYEDKLLTNQNSRLIRALEKELEIKLSEYSCLRLSLWISISKKRIMVSDKKYKDIKRKMKSFKKDSLYLKTRKLILLYFSRYSVEIGEEESMLHFIFLTSMSILSEKDFNMYDLVRGRRTPTSVADAFIRETVLLYYRPRKPSIKLERMISYHFSQINSLLYFFEGGLVAHDSENLHHHDGQFLSGNLPEFSKELLGLALETYQEIESKGNTLHRLAQFDYLNVLVIIDLTISNELRIGIDLFLQSSSEEVVSQMLMLHLKGVVGITVDEYQENRVYDLVITNESSSEIYPSFSDVYVLSDACSKFDIRSIKEKITLLKESSLT